MRLNFYVKFLYKNKQIFRTQAIYLVFNYLP